MDRQQLLAGAAEEIEKNNRAVPSAERRNKFIENLLAFILRFLLNFFRTLIELNYEHRIRPTNRQWPN